MRHYRSDAFKYVFCTSVWQRLPTVSNLRLEHLKENANKQSAHLKARVIPRIPRVIEPSRVWILCNACIAEDMMSAVWETGYCFWTNTLLLSIPNVKYIPHTSSEVG